MGSQRRVSGDGDGDGDGDYLHHFADRIEGTPHDEEAGQLVDEHGPHPGRHRVSLRRTKVDVQHQYRYTNAIQREKKGV